MTPVVNLKQLMEWVIDPAADVIWDSVKTVYTQGATKEVKPETDEQWAAVRNAAAALTEGGSMLLAEGRARDSKGWVTAVRSLVAGADKALKAAEAKNVEALFDAGGELYVACRSCHQQYAPQLNALQAPPGIAASHTGPDRLAAAAHAHAGARP